VVLCRGELLQLWNVQDHYVGCVAKRTWLVGKLGETPNRPRPFHDIRGPGVAEHSTIVLKIHVQQRFLVTITSVYDYHWKILSYNVIKKIT
jgi:hypothetical protein